MATFLGRRNRLAGSLALVLGGVPAASPALAAPQFTVIHTFLGTDGELPLGGMIVDATGALFGVTSLGGTFSTKCVDNTTDFCGTAFELAPPPPGRARFTETVLHDFTGPDGYEPTTRLVADASGALYGTTFRSNTGAKDCTTVTGLDCGVVYKLTPPGPGQTLWSETVLFEFGNVGKRFAGGFAPLTGLTIDASGALIGTTFAGGSQAGDCLVRGCGVVFRLTPPATEGSMWTETVIHTFQQNDRDDGAAPRGELIQDVSGALYGTTTEGGVRPAGVPGLGTVYKLTPPAYGQTNWTEEVLHSFEGPDGNTPVGALLADDSGELFGTTIHGGAGLNCAQDLTNCGVAYKLTPPADGQTKWTETIIHQFGSPGDGASPIGALIADAKGYLFGVCAGGPGHVQQIGTVFELKPPAAGETEWTELTLHTFTTNLIGGAHGSVPNGALVAFNGSLYGMASMGGRTSFGVIFKVTP